MDRTAEVRTWCFHMRRWAYYWIKKRFGYLKMSNGGQDKEGIGDAILKGSRNARR